MFETLGEKEVLMVEYESLACRGGLLRSTR